MTHSHWIWGRRPVLEALRSGSARRVLMLQSVEPSFRRSIEAAVTLANTPLEIVDRTRIDGIVPSGKSQGVVASVARISARDPDAIIAAATSSNTPALLLVLEEIQDPGNLGSLIRSAEAAGCHGVIVTEHRTAPLRGTVSKSSAGAVHHLPIAATGNMSHLLERLKNSGVWTIGLSAEAGQTIYACDLAAPTAIVVGGEGSGLRRLTAERVDLMASIPMRGRIGSLNASVAGAIALFESVRQRQTGPHLSKAGSI